MQEKLIYMKHWIPTKESATKYTDISFEKFYNSYYKKDESKTVLELLINFNGNFEKLISDCGIEIFKENKLIKKHYKRAFRGKLENEYSYKSVF